MPNAEIERLGALHDFAVLDTLPEARFDRLTALAAEMFDAPVALVSLIDDKRQWFKSRVGLETTETPRDWAFCDHTIQGARDSTFVVTDAATDPRFADNPLVTGDLGLRFYAGAVLTTAQGHNVGTLCVIDKQARRAPTQRDLKRLSVLARMVVDELELSQATRELAERKRILVLAETMSGVGYWRYGVADGKVTWSDEVYRIYGLDRASFEPEGEATLAFYHPDDRAPARELFRQALADGKDFNFQLRLIVKGGEVRQVVCKASCDVDHAGVTTAIIGVFQDVTAQAERLAAVEQSEARYRLLADNANDLVSQFTPDGRLTFITPSCHRILGFMPHELVGLSGEDVIHPEDLCGVKEFAAGLCITDPLCTEVLQYRIRHRDGHWVWLEGQPKMVFDAETGEPAFMQDTMRDITKRKALELELEEARAETEAAAAIKSEFLANMSHELRTPLTSIVGFSGLLLNTVELSVQGRRYVERVSQASDVLLNIVNDILDFSKLEAGQVEIEHISFDATALIKNTIELLKPQAGAKGLSLVVGYTDLPASIISDETRLRQILLNLISNAVKFTTVGGVTVEASYDRNTERLRCEVCDTGAGVPAERLDRLFKRFSQVDGSTTRSHGGTGLGLAICKGLAEAMGGEVGAKSTVGEGSCFWLEIPCPMEGAPDATAQAEPESANGFSGLRVLVADDNPQNRDIVRIILETYGAQVAEAGSGAEALLLAQASRFDVILMDIRMPDLDGPSAAAAIRDGDGPNAATPIVAFTADIADVASPGERPLFDGYLAKPLLAADLLTAVSGWGDVRQPASLMRSQV